MPQRPPRVPTTTTPAAAAAAAAATTTTIPLTSTFHHQTATHSHSIAYTTLGSPSSPPVIFIHGTPWSSTVWAPFALSLSQDFHVYLFDNPGFGASPLGEPLGLVGAGSQQEQQQQQQQQITEAQGLDADLADQSAVFAALFKFWEAEAEDDDDNDEKEGGGGGGGGSNGGGGWQGRKPQVIAHDHGGLMALRAHLLHGCEYASLCLVDVVALTPPGDVKKPLFTLVANHHEAFEQLSALEDGATAVFDGVVEGYIRDAAYTALSKPVVEALMEPWTQRGPLGRRGFIRQMVQASRRSVVEVEARYAEVGATMPVRVVWGNQDKWIPVETATRLASALGVSNTEAAVRVIDRAGHLIMYDQPARLGVELGLWLGSNLR